MLYILLSVRDKEIDSLKKGLKDAEEKIELLKYKMEKELKEVS